MGRAREVSSIVAALAALLVASALPASAVDLGPAPGACPTPYVGPYPARHDFCLRTSQYGTLSVTPAEVGDGSEFTLTLSPTIPRCTGSSSTFPCVEFTNWGAGDAVGSGPSYRLLLSKDRTSFRDIGGKLYYYVPFDTLVTAGTPPACNASSISFETTCKYRVGFRNPASGLVPTSWAVWNMNLTVRTSATTRVTAWLEATSRMIGNNAENQSPTAAFTWEARDDAPLTVDFDASGSTDDKGITTYAWDFGDGGTGNGVTAVHTFAGPGTYPVRLTVTDTQGATNAVTRQVVLAPLLDVQVSLLDDSVDRFELGQEFDVAVTVSSIGSGGGDLSSLEFVGAVLDTGEEGRVVVVSGPTPVPPATFSLPPGESESFVFRLRAEASGPVVLSSQVQGEDANGEPVEAFGSRQIRIGGLLDVAVVVNPTAVDLEDDTSGHKPQPVTAVVTVTNVHSQPISNVVLDPLDLRSRRLPAPVPASLVVLSGPFVQLPAPQPPDPSALGTIAPGVSVTRFYSLEARNDGHYDVQALVRAADPVSGGTLVESGMGEVKILTDVDFYFESVPLGAEDRNGALWKPGGLHWEVQGKIENRSADKKLLVVLLPKLIGNAFYGLPIIEGTAPPDDVCAMGTARSMPHDEKLTFKAPVRTLAEGGTRGIYQLVPQVLIENPDGSRTPLGEDRILIKPGSTEHTVHVDVGIPPPERSLDELYGARLLGTVEGLGRFAEGIWDLAVMAGKVVKFGLQPWQWDDAYRVAGDKVAGYLVDLYENLPEHEKQMFNDDLADAVAIALGGAYQDVSGLVNRAAEQRFTELTTAYYSGDSFEVARWFGRLEGELAPEVALEVLTGGLAVCKLGARGRRTVEAALEAKAASQAASLERRAAEGARALRNHDILDYERHLRGIFGIDRVSDRMFREFAKTWKIVLVFRRRGAGVLEKLRTGKFTLKPAAIKAKNVDHIDAEFLGLRRVDSTPTPPGPSLTDEVVIGDPPPWSEVQSKLGGRDPEFVEEVRERWTTRWEEWHGKGAHPETGAGGVGGEKAEWLLHEQRGSIPYSKQSVAGIQENVEKGFSIPKDDTVQTYKNFEIERTVGPTGREIWVCKIEDPIKGWQGVTGDLDLMAITRADGTPVPPEARIKMYRALRHLGIQHPETLTWTNKAGLRKYLDQFGTHNPNSEAMAAYMPDGKNVIATRYVDGQSWINPLDPKNSAKFFYDGATMAIRAEAVTPNDMQHLEADAQAVPAVYIAPDTWTFIRPGCTGGGITNAEGDGCLLPVAVQFTNDPDSLIVRQTAVGVLEQWTPETGWQPLALEQPAVRVRPQTSLSEPAAAGANIIEINDLAQLGLAPEVNAWFQVGQRVVINPGGANQETAVIVGFGSLLLAEPLRFDHQAGELVTALDGTVGHIPVIRLLSGRQLAMKYKASKPTSRKLAVSSKDKAQTDLGDPAGIAALLAEGGSLRLVAVGGDEFDVELPLPASGWKPIRKKHPEKGIRFRGTGAIRLVVVKPGKQLTVKGQGADLAFTLVEEPETVQVQLEVGARRMCLAFPRGGKFVAEKQLVRVKAAQAPACPAE